MLTGIIIAGVVGGIAAAFGLGRRGLADQGVQSITRVNGEVDAPALAGRMIIAVGAGAFLSLAGMRLETTISQNGFSGDTRDMNANLFASSGPGAITVTMQNVPTAVLNNGLASVSGGSAGAWKENPYGAIFVQQEGNLFRAAYIDESFVNNHHQTQLKVITFDKDHAPTYLSSIPPNQSYPSLLNSDGSVNNVGTAAMRNGTVLSRGVQTAMTNGDIHTARYLTAAASAVSHQSQQ